MSYTPKNWQTGELITADKLNNMGQGIDEAMEVARTSAETAEQIATNVASFVGAPLKASTVSEMTDTDKIYVYVGSETGYTAGHWYYYNGSAWTDGGIYNSVAVQTDTTLSVAGMAADAAAAGEVKSAVSSAKIVLYDMYINGTTWTARNAAGAILIPVSGGDTVDIKATSVGSNSQIVILKNVTFPITSGATATFSSEVGYNDWITVSKNTERTITIPSDGEYLYAYRGFSSSSYNREPQMIRINGYDYMANVTANVVNACQTFAEIDDIRTEFGSYNALQWFKGRWVDGAWLTDTNNSAFLKVEPGASYKIQAVLDGNSPIAALKSAVLPPVDGELIDYSSDESWTDFIFPSYGTIVEGTVPADVNFLYFYFGGSTLSRMPEKIIINGYDVKKDLLQSVIENTAKIEELSAIDNSVLPNFAMEQTIKTTGHGGYTATYPLNSLMGFRDAKQHGFKWAEADVQFTSDSVPVLCHDDGLYTYARNPDGSRVGTSLEDTVFISEITYDELLDYDFGLAKSSSLAGMKITTFEQLMQSARRMDLSISIEIKRNKTPTDAQIDILFELIDKYHMRQHVNFCSAVREVLEYIHGKDPAMDLAYIVDSISTSAVNFVESIRGYNKVAIGADKSITDAMVLLAKQRNIPVGIGTVTNNNDILNANPYITQFTSNGPIAEDVMLNYELSQLS